MVQPACLVVRDDHRQRWNACRVGLRRPRARDSLRAGWSRNIFKTGEAITIDMSPARDGSKTGMIARVTKADGTILGNSPSE